MTLTALAYPTLVYIHLLLFVLWLGADVGVFLLGQHFRKRDRYTLDQRIALLQLLVLVDMTPRTAWALMVPLSLTISALGGWWQVPGALVIAGWLIGGVWLWLVWDSHNHDQTPRAARGRPARPCPARYRRGGSRTTPRVGAPRASWRSVRPC